MLRFLRRGKRWLTGFLVVGVGIVFAVFIGTGAPLRFGSSAAVVAVGPYEFGATDFERERAQLEERYREALGAQFDPKALSDGLDQMAVRSLTERGLLALEAERMGLTVATPEIERAVAPLFAGEDGRVDRSQFKDWVDYQYGSEKAFVRDQRLFLLSRKLLRVAADQSRVSEGEARDAVRRRLEAVRIAFPVLDGGRAPAGEEPTPEQVRAFLASRDADARRLYDERKSVYDVPERIRARHVLIQAAKDAPPDAVAAAEARAGQALERLKGGEDFAKVAGELSNDEGSRAAGGDLGFFARGQMVQPFEEAAFALEPGQLSGLVRTDFGFHVIRVDERKPAELRGYEQVREELAKEILGREAGRAAARAKADALAAAVRGGKSLEDAAREAGLTLERSGWLRRRADGYVPNLGPAPELLAVAFALPAGASSDRVFEVGDRFALVEVLERKEPTPEEVDPAVAAERKALEERELEAQVRTWLDERQSELLDAGELVVNLEPVRRR
jgi:peptidyl-prolyl cis-trans isomerase D